VKHNVKVKTLWKFQCRDRNGILKWTEEFANLVVTEGLNKLLDATFKTGVASPAWYVGLKDTGTVAAGDTIASHPGWAELTCFSEGSRPGFTPGTVSGGSVDNSASKAVFSINTSDDIYGGFICDDATKGGTSGTLYGAGDFTGGAKSVSSGDQLSVTITLSVSST
jgi:hypothetical protein